MRKKEIDKKTRLYYWIIMAKIVADITIIIGVFIIFYFIVRKAFL